MDFMECVMGRRSVRRFKPETVDDALIEKVVQAATYAPSWKNAQTTRYIAISNAGLKTQIAEECVMGSKFNKNIILNAPVIVLLTTVSPFSGFEPDGAPSTTKGTHWESFDAGIAAQTFCLSAFEQGLGTVILGIFDEDKVIKTAKTPAGQKISAIIALGYPDEAPRMPKRIKASAILTFQK